MTVAEVFSSPSCGRVYDDELYELYKKAYRC
jgi:hypothetical protein